MQPFSITKPWLKNYPVNMPYEVDIYKYNNLLEVFERAVREHPDQPAFVNMGQVLTFRKLDERSRSFAAYLQNELKLQKGDRIALMMPNLLQYPISLYAALRAGLVVVNVNPLYTAHELRHQLKDSGAKAIVIVSNFAQTLEKIVFDTDIEHVILSRMGDQLSFGKRTAVNFVVKYIKKLVPKYKLPKAVSFREALSVGKNRQYVKPSIGRDDYAFLQYTGGTTGRAKGAILTHGNIVSNIMQARWVGDQVIDSSKDLYGVIALPLYHIFALTINCLLFIELGLCAVLITNPRDIDGFIKEIKKYPFVAITGVNTLYNALLNNPEVKTINFKPLKLSVAGGMAIQQKVAQKWYELTNTHIVEGYGMTECSPLISASLPHQGPHKGHIGMPIPNTEIKLVDDNCNEINQINQAGELWVKGPQVMQGYWQQPEDTALVLHDGWMATGDIVIVDDESNLRIVDRKKDMIVVSGFNVYPNEIEDAVMLCPEVLEVVAFGVPHEVSGETIKVIIVKKDAKLSADKVKQHCRKYLTGYKIPRIIEFAKELPKSNVGKILRRECRDLPTDQELNK